MMVSSVVCVATPDAEARAVAVYVPVGAVPVAATVSVLELPSTGEGLQPTFTPTGNPVIAIVTDPLNPPVRVTVTGNVCDCPSATVNVVDVPNDTATPGVGTGSLLSEHPAAITNARADLRTCLVRMPVSRNWTGQ
jgi:hypothetical protein